MRALDAKAVCKEVMGIPLRLEILVALTISKIYNEQQMKASNRKERHCLRLSSLSEIIGMPKELLREHLKKLEELRLVKRINEEEEDDPLYDITKEGLKFVESIKLLDIINEELHFQVRLDTRLHGRFPLL